MRKVTTARLDMREHQEAVWTLGGSEQLADLLMLSYEPMLAWDLNGPIKLWNTGAERLYGFTSKEALGRVSHSLLRTAFPVTPAELFAKLQNERRWAGQLHHTRKNGQLAVVDSRMQLLDDGTVLEVNRDVTERKEIEATLRETEERLRFLASIIESSDDAIVSKSLDGIITSWNKGAERVFGYTAEEVIGQPITIVIPENRHNEEREILTRIRRGERINHFETVRQRKEGSLIAVSLTVSPVKNAAGKIIGASKIARDITEQKRNQERIAALAHEAEHRSKNLIATVQAAVNLSHSDTPEGLKKAIEGRIRALANAHFLFVESRWIGADLSVIAAQELAPYSEGNERRVLIHGAPILLAPAAAQAVAMILHELATNAVKYGSLSDSEGRLDLNWFQGADGLLTLSWKETGGPIVQPPSRRGFGSRIIEHSAGQLQGKTQFDWRAEGLICEITVQN
jgi:PAS domain S-box-containing protein